MSDTQSHVPAGLSSKVGTMNKPRIIFFLLLLFELLLITPLTVVSKQLPIPAGEPAAYDSRRLRQTPRIVCDVRPGQAVLFACPT
jgi:hypothetical protein